ncbi:hypothetical protein EI94DRAFT_395141 [Lactarius quietus]|nr:hypothetical protein EI94DRAFT_395141 [Lactarius quietus]
MSTSAKQRRPIPASARSAPTAQKPQHESSLPGLQPGFNALDVQHASFSIAGIRCCHHHTARSTAPGTSTLFDLPPTSAMDMPIPEMQRAWAHPQACIDTFFFLCEPLECAHVNVHARSRSSCNDCCCLLSCLVVPIVTDACYPPFPASSSTLERSPRSVDFNATGASGCWTGGFSLPHCETQGRYSLVLWSYTGP